jgi:glycosyltransferase involved in cell wall biosynthesis
MIKKVCRLVWDYPRQGKSTYGLQPVFVNLSEEQVRKGYEVHVVSTIGPNAPREELVNGVHVHRLPTPYNLTAISKINALTSGSSEWVVHSHATAGFLLFATKGFRRFPLVCQVHGTSRSHHTPLKFKEGAIVVDYSSRSVNYHMMRERLLWSSADRVLTVSGASSLDVTNVYKIRPEVVRVVYNGVDSELFRPMSGSPIPPQIEGTQGKRIILYVGHFGMRKGLFYLIRALRLVKKEIPDCHLVCVGGVPRWLKGPDFWKILLREAELQGVSHDMTLLDAVPNSQLANFYRNADIFVLPSYYETFSKVCLEAMSCGKPVVASRSGGLPEVIEDGKTGTLVKYGSVPQIAAATIDILSDERKARDMGLLARARVERMFTWGAVADRVSAVYRELDRQES